MTEKNIETFLNTLADDSAMQARLSATINETIISFAADAGFEFTADDLLALNDKLSDEALDSVTGGSFLTDAGRSLKDWFLPHRISKDEKKNPWNHP
ncbi:Nif11-like leader peptide family natural product precursor [Spiribacter sp. C176]|uniref:Nif11-like leader peptide family natural product n=1 Tax=Spiribacter salilacus TaxID=2664894 RepID=A0A6N7QNH6_9GAMM|nr:Nif11-like leader peptide family RiPP precursor [Spiribacter salilacus]MRH77592.1 Nif11-like leader peptide family natural product precursor [Spiribacter salilacus]